MNKQKKNIGITLIALIITIIVLLILAGVTINMVLGENGLFNKAKTSVGKYENAQARENTVLTGYENKIENSSRETVNYERNIIELIYGGYDHYNTTQEEQWTLIPFIEGEKTGTKLSYHNNGVLIGKDVKKVKVSYYYQTDSIDSSVWYIRGSVFINDIVENKLNSANEYTMYRASLSHAGIISVKEGDLITGKIMTRKAGGFNVWGSQSLIVEVVE